MAEPTEIDLNFTISPYTEMSKEREKFCKNDKDISKILQDWKFKEKISVNPRKWKEKTLIQALHAIARYELKIFDAKIGQDIDKIKDPKELIRKIEKHYKKIGDQIEDKIFNALEEIVEDKGDDLKALKEGKAALDKVDGFNPDGVFSTIASEATKLLNKLESEVTKELKDKAAADGKLEKEKERIEDEIDAIKEKISENEEKLRKLPDEIKELQERLKNDEGDGKKIKEELKNKMKEFGEKKKETADFNKEIKSKEKDLNKMKADWSDDDLSSLIKMSEKKLEMVLEDGKKEVENATKATEYLRDVAEKLKKNKNVSPSLVDFAGKIIKADKEVFEKWEKAAQVYFNNFGIAQGMLSKGEIEVRNIQKAQSLIATTGGPEKLGATFEKKLGELTKEFRNLEKELK